MSQKTQANLDGSNPSCGHLPELDGLRAVSIVFVLLLHVSYGNVSGGFLGVDIFFVLSGFLITALLIGEREKNGRINLAHFYLRRAFRILPTVICGLILAGSLRVASYPVADSFWRAATRVLLFVSNFYESDIMGNLAHTWSLSIEEQFYLVWPLVIAFLCSSNLRIAAYVASVWVIGAMAFRAFYLLDGGAPINLYTMTIARMDSILIGCLIAVGRSKICALLASFRPDWMLWMATVVMMFFLICSNRMMLLSRWWLFTFFALVSALFILLSLSASVEHPVRSFLRMRFVRYLGSISFGLYVYHYPTFLWLEQFRYTGSLLNFVGVATLKVILSVVVAAISWKFIEQPSISYRKRLLRHAL